MKRTIKVTKNQLRETEGVAFKYLEDGNDVPSSNGTREIGVTGKTDDGSYGVPADGDKIANTMTVQGWNRYLRHGSCATPGNIRENDANGDGVSDFYNHDELDTLSDGNKDNNLIRIPNGVDHKLDVLIDSISSLQPKQQAMVVNKLIETMELDKIPYAWAKELMNKILSRNNIGKKNDTSNQ